MNRPTKLILIGAAAAVAISGASANSISLQEPPSLPAAETFSLTVENGKPSGNYEAGTQVIVSAEEPPAGSQFAGWTGDIAILANPFISRTTATIPSTAVAIKATYTEPSQAANTDSAEAPTSSEEDPAPTTTAAPAADANWQG